MIPGSATPALISGADAAATGSYEISRSLRFNSTDSAHLSRTPASAGNRKTWTWAGWVKVSKQQGFPDQKGLFFAGPSNDNFFRIMFQSSNGQLRLDNFANGSSATTLVTTQVFRDFSAWMHIVLAVDTTQTTPSNRFKIYVNETQITTFSIATYQAQNTDTLVNSTNAHSIGNLLNHSPPYYFDGYLADIHFIDGQALTPSSFTKVRATTGQLIPKAYAGTYTGNSFWLKFNDNSAATATTLGKDSFLLGNNWTPNNFSVAAGVGNDSMVDVPTSWGVDTGLGGQVRGNYPTLNINSIRFTPNIQNGALHLNGSSNNDSGAMATMAFPTTGKWYWDFTMGPVNNVYLPYSGLFSKENFPNGNSVNVPGTLLYPRNSAVCIYNNTGAATCLSEIAVEGDVYGIAYNADTGNVDYYKNGVQYIGYSNTVTQGIVYYPGLLNGNVNTSAQINFGQRPFAYAAPAGFKALCDTNLPAPLVALPNTVMDVKLWTGNGAARSISGLAFSPDFAWIKGRSGATDHALYDAVRGVQLDLVSNSAAAETTQAQGLTAFNSDGFSLGTLAKVNTSSATYVGWTWDAGTSTVTNTQGSITSQVRANASAGFSVVTYTGNGANATVGHGLGVAAGLVIVKRRNTTASWQVRHTSIAAASSIQLNLTNAAASATTVWNSTAPSSTVFSVGTDATVNASGATYVAYCFAPVAGYSSFGSYTGNGSANGPFVYTGFRPRWIMVKRTDSAVQWTILDTARSPKNVADERLFPNLSQAETVNGDGNTDLLSNGFKPRNIDSAFNTNGGTYIYMAFAENPFQYARAR